MKISIRLMVLFCVIVTSSHVFAEARAPQLVILAFVEALQKNNIEYLKKYVDLDKIKNQPRHSYTVKQLKTLFTNVDMSKIVSSKPVYDKETKIIRVRMNQPLSFDFELQHQNLIQKTISKDKGDFYRIIGIHP